MYSFDKITNRRNTNSTKWNVKENELPMWIADMDFEVAPEIREELEKVISQGIYGYTDIPEQWADAYSDWWAKRHNYRMSKESLIFCTGVIPAISSIVRKLTTPGEKVLVQTPVYNIFFNSILNNGRLVLESPLVYDGTEYNIDFNQLEKDLSDPQVSLMILCNPHNPVGKIWKREELEEIGVLCEKYHVTVISDEIHCDLVEPGKGYIPFASVSDVCRDISITCIAPTKAFNIAGLHTSAVHVPNENLRHKVWRSLNTDEVAEPNVFAAVAAIAAFTKGEQWINELNSYIQKNRQFTDKFLRENIPKIKMIPSDATYLLWIDVGNVTDDSKQLAKFIREKTGLYLTGGCQYRGNGNRFLRLNIACPRSILEEGLNRLDLGVRVFHESI